MGWCGARALSTLRPAIMRLWEQQIDTKDDDDFFFFLPLFAIEPRGLRGGKRALISLTLFSFFREPVGINLKLIKARDLSNIISVGCR